MALFRNVLWGERSSFGIRWACRCSMYIVVINGLPEHWGRGRALQGLRRQGRFGALLIGFHLSE